jgi:hypothetical protein
LTAEQKKIAAELGRIGGETRAKKLSAKKRRAIALKASRAPLKSARKRHGSGRRSRRPSDMAELIETVWLYGEDGTQYRAHLYHSKIKASSLDGSNFILGEKTASLEDGTHLNYVDEHTFKNVVTDELLSRTRLAKESAEL